MSFGHWDFLIRWDEKDGYSEKLASTILKVKWWRSNRLLEDNGTKGINRSWGLVEGWVLYAMQLTKDAPMIIAGSIMSDCCALLGVKAQQVYQYANAMNTKWPGLLGRRGWLWVLACTMGFDVTYTLVRDYPTNHPVLQVIFSETQIN